MTADDNQLNGWKCRYLNEYLQNEYLYLKARHVWLPDLSGVTHGPNSIPCRRYRVFFCHLPPLFDALARIFFSNNNLNKKKVIIKKNQSQKESK